MGGRYGSEHVTACCLEIVYIDADQHLIFVRGSVPGRSKGILKLKPTTRRKKHVAQEFKVHRIGGEEAEQKPEE